jgi:hypothetical protein
MSCGELERLFVSGVADDIAREHAAACPACAAAARDAESVNRLTAGLRPPAWRESLRESLLSVPGRTVSCETTDGLIARAMENEKEIDFGQRRRLDFHLSRCEACTEAAQTLFGMRRLAAPQPAPWFAGRIAASAPAHSARPARRRGAWRWLLDPKAAIALAYAAAVVVMLAGFNPADLARKARTDIPQEARSVVADARTTLADRVGAFGEKALRAVMVARSRAFGYGRAALSNAVQLVMKAEPAPPPSRPRSGEEKSVPWKNETANTTWRA